MLSGEEAPDSLGYKADAANALTSPGFKTHFKCATQWALRDFLDSSNMQSLAVASAWLDTWGAC